ncbi:MAG TPA: hypothetical protein VM490_00120 [Armatimonadaceae bacterium]|nr:hypothetical protein [Armatimonadaceae bacterium]
MARLPVVLVAGAMLLLLVSLAPRTIATAQRPSPPHSNAYDHTLEEWLKLYVTWFVGGSDSDTVKNVRFLPLPVGVLVSGSGAPSDPAVLVGNLDVTLKPGTPFVLPMVLYYGESYEPGTPVPVNPDPVLPLSVWNASEMRITLDGKTIIDSSREDKFRYFVPTTYFDPPVVYSQPTGYGSTQMNWIQGFVFVHPPLSKGTHTLTLESSTFLPGGGFYPNVPDGWGFIYQNTWTITVK